MERKMESKGVFSKEIVEKIFDQERGSFTGFGILVLVFISLGVMNWVLGHPSEAYKYMRSNFYKEFTE